MKKIFTLLIGIVFSITILNAQQAPPQAFSYKATIMKNNGAIVANKTISLRVGILHGSSAVVPDYSETFHPTTNEFGQIDIVIGRGGTGFSSIGWSSGEYYLQTEVDVKGGTDWQLLSVAQLLSVPYALYAGKAGNAFSGNYSDLYNAPTNLSQFNNNVPFLKIESDPVFTLHPAHGITSGSISNWNTTYSWGNHAGLYRPVSYVPAWSEITDIPIFATVATSGSYNDLTNKPSGTNPGDMQYWNGTNWVMVPVGSNGQVLTLINGIPTWGSGSIPVNLPILTTTAASSITLTTATSGGNITSDGEASVTTRGVCWNTSANPTITNSKTTDGNGICVFTSLITGLTSSTTYYLRAYATNSVGTAYGNEISFTTLSPINIGDSFQGGKVAYILQSGDPGYDSNVPHGLIAAAADQSTLPQWGCYGILITGADGTALGTGNQNTIDIMAGCPTPGIAARLCGDLVLNGFSDWYLPSIDELNKLYINRAAVGGFASFPYWSSTENLNNNAWFFRFDGGYPHFTLKNNQAAVRAVRSF